MAGWGAAAAVLLPLWLHGGHRGSATAVSAAPEPAATAVLIRHQLCGGQWRSCSGQRWQPNCGSDGAVASSGRSAAAAAVREGLTAVAAARGGISATSTTTAEAVQASARAGRLLQRLSGEISAASTTAAVAVQASAVAGTLLQRLHGEISASSTTAAAMVRGSVACIAVVVMLSSCCVQS